METNNFFGTQTKIRLHKIESVRSKKRTAFGTLNLNLQAHQQDKTEPTMKRSVSIVNMVHRISQNTLSKKTQQILSSIQKMPKKDRHLMTAQIKCFMTTKHSHDSHLLDYKIVSNAIQKLKNSDRLEKCYHFNYTKFILLCQIVFKKGGDTNTLIRCYEDCVAQLYPPSVQMMLLYFGVFFYSVNSRYEEAEKYCQKLFDVIVKFKIQEFFIIYLILRIKLKTNLSEWEDSLSLLTKLLFFSWMYNLADLQIWCYFQFSRAYFFLEQPKQCQLFKQKSESSSIEPKRSIYREVSISNLIIEIEAIWQGQLDFKFNYVIQDNRLFLPKFTHYGVEDYISDQRKLKSNIKSIIEDCKIRHVGNLLTRIGQIGMHSIQKQSNQPQQQPFLTSKSSQNSPSSSLSPASTQTNFFNNIPNRKSGNNFLLTHKSHNKNMCMFFRKRSNENSSNRVFYTIENSQKNWAVLKQMIKNIYIEMSYWCPFIHQDK